MMYAKSIQKIESMYAKSIHKEDIRMINKIFAVDAGKFATKAMAGDERLMFRSNYTRIDESNSIPLEGCSFKVEIDNKTYILGDMGEESDYSLEKQSVLHKMATYTAIAKLGGRDDVKVAVGCPVSIFKSDENRKLYAEYMKEQPQMFKVDDVSIKIKIDKIVVLPEGSGPIYTDERFKNKRVAVIDLGGRNMNFTIYNNRLPQVSSMFTENYGSMDIETLIKQQFDTKYRCSLEDKDVRAILEQGGIKYKGQLEGQKHVKEILEGYVDKVLARVQKANFNLDTMDVVFTGGTSLLVEEEIKQRLSHAEVIKDAQWSNAEGFNKIVRRKFDV